MTFLIFDIDGTLTNTMAVEDKCFFKAFELTFGLDISDQDWADFQNVTDWGITEEIMERNFNRQPSPIEYNSLMDTFTNLLKAEMSKDKTQFSEVPGASDFLALLSSEPEFAIGFATGSWSHSASIKLQTIGIQADQFAFSNSDHHKSREDITRHAISQLQEQTGRSPKQIIYFGDGIWDFKTCQNLEIPFIGIDVNGNGKLVSLGAEVVFRDYLDQSIILEAIRDNSWNHSG
jgi:beta-phosphoglucomutase-like phosphatase (HAD superfamily)